MLTALWAGVALPNRIHVGLGNFCSHLRSRRVHVIVILCSLTKQYCQCQGQEEKVPVASQFLLIYVHLAESCQDVQISASVCQYSL